MKLWLAKTVRGLVPADDASQAIFDRMGMGECAEFSIVRPRSLAWHRMYFGICRAIGQNQDPPRDEDSIDAELRVRAGHFDVMLVGEHEVRVPKRIAFAKLGGDEWAELWPSIELAIRETFGEEYVQELAVG